MASVIVIRMTAQSGLPVKRHMGMASKATIKNIQSLFAIRMREDSPSPIAANTKLHNAVTPVTHAPGPPPLAVWAKNAIAVSRPHTNQVNAWGLISPFRIPFT